METFYQTYKDRAAFLFVYIREAHPADGWQAEENKKEEVIFSQPTEWTARKETAQACCQRLRLSMPCVVDTIDNTVDNLYAGWPERIFVISANGRIAYAGKQGPWGFKPEEAELELRRHLGRGH